MSIFSRKKEVVLKSIVRGKIIPITGVPDKMFAKKMLGDGVGFELEENQIYAPCDAEVLMVADTKHAIGLKLKNGMEILIHIGLDTVELNGEGFTAAVAAGDRVKEGQVLMTIDRGFMESRQISLITPLVVTEAKNYKMDVMKENEKVEPGDESIRFYKN